MLKHCMTGKCVLDVSWKIDVCLECHLDVLIWFKYIVFSFMLVISLHVTCGCIRAIISSASSC